MNLHSGACVYGSPWLYDVTIDIDIRYPSLVLYSIQLFCSAGLVRAVTKLGLCGNANPGVSMPLISTAANNH